MARDIDGDFKVAYLAEYKAALISGDTERAAACAAELKRYGVEPEGGEAAERAVPEAPHKERRTRATAKKEDA